MMIRLGRIRSPRRSGSNRVITGLVRERLNSERGASHNARWIVTALPRMSQRGSENVQPRSAAAKRTRQCHLHNFSERRAATTAWRGRIGGRAVDLEQGARDVEMLSQTASEDAFNRTVRIAEPKSAGEVHVGLCRKPLVQQPERRVVSGPHEPIDDPPCLIGAD